MKFALPITLFLSLTAVSSAAALDASPKQELAMPKADKEVMKVTPQGLIPAEVTFKEKDSSLFFVNATEDSLITLSINFGDHNAHCASGNLKFEGGKMFSTSPIGPKDFAITCFPQTGVYEVKIEGLAGHPAPIIGHVKVE